MADEPETNGTVLEDSKLAERQTSGTVIEDSNLTDNIETERKLENKNGIGDANPKVRNVENGNVKKGMDLDTILVEEIGQFGLYQLRIVLLAIIIVIFNAWSSVEYVFTTSNIPKRCLIPECETLTSPADFRPPWLANAVNSTGTSFDNCHRFANISTIDNEVQNTCPANLFDQSRLVECEHFVYENTNTVVYDFDLGCDDWLRSSIGTFRTMGVFAAAPLTGFISDRWGRKVALIFNSFNTAWLGILRYFADTYAGFVVSEFVEALFGSGMFSSAYILVAEVVGPKYRVACGASMNSFFAVGQITMGLIAWGVPNWRLFTITLYSTQFLTIFYIWLMSESVRWLMSNGRYERSDKILKNIARVNGKTLSDKSLEMLRIHAEDEKQKLLLEKERKSNEPWLIVKVFRYKPILLRCCLAPVWWITTTFIYYGLSLNSISMSGHRYVNYIAVAAVEIPGYWMAFLLIGVVGRKPVLTAAYWICAACQIGYIFMPDDLAWLSLVVYLIGKFSIAMVMTSVYVYTTELFPTEHRHSLFGFCFMMGRIGSMLAPLTPALGSAVWVNLPFVLFAAMSLLSGALVLITPETLGAPLPDTMDESANLGKNKTTR